MKKIIFIVLVILCIVFCFQSLITIDKEIYNNDICTECGGNYEFERTISHSSYIEYKYTCNSCGHSIRIETKF